MAAAKKTPKKAAPKKAGGKKAAPKVSKGRAALDRSVNKAASDAVGMGGLGPAAPPTSTRPKGVKGR
jgi:hypothetical protein